MMPTENMSSFKGRKITRGVAQGKALVTRQPFMLAHGINPKTGEITDVKHELEGQSISGRIFVFPFVIGSSTGGAWLLEAIRCNCGPAAVINKKVEATLVTAVVMSEILYNKVVPTIDQLDIDPTQVIRTGDHVKVDANRGIVEIIKS